MKRVLIVILAITSLAGARDKKQKVFPPGPYVFTSKASAGVLKRLIVQENLREGYILDSDKQLEFRFSMPSQMPLVGALFMASSDCPGKTTRKVWSYALKELDGMTKVTVLPFWEYPDDYCQIQTHELIWNQPEEMTAFQAMLDKAPTLNAQVATPSSTPASPAPAPGSTPKSTADQQQSAQQHAACLELAKDNPSITCR